MDSLKVSTAALASGDSANDDRYIALTNKIVNWTSDRDAIALEMMTMLDGATFNDDVFNEVRAKQLIAQAQALLKEVRSCAANIPSCAQ